MIADNRVLSLNKNSYDIMKENDNLKTENQKQWRMGYDIECIVYTKCRCQHHLDMKRSMIIYSKYKI